MFRGGDLADVSGVTKEVIIGRGLAFCAHPQAAWRRLPPKGRALIVATYFCAGYLGVLTGLLIF